MSLALEPGACLTCATSAYLLSNTVAQTRAPCSIRTSCQYSSLRDLLVSSRYANTHLVRHQYVPAQLPTLRLPYMSYSLTSSQRQKLVLHQLVSKNDSHTNYWTRSPDRNRRILSSHCFLQLSRLPPLAEPARAPSLLLPSRHNSKPE